jgi:thioredoxin 1
MRTNTSAPATSAPEPGAPYLDGQRFAAVVEQTHGLALIDFTAAWCPPCRMLGPSVDALARELAPNVVIAKVDVDDHPELASRFGVLSMPTLLFFRGGQLVDRIVGVVPIDHLRAKLDEHAKSELTSRAWSGDPREEAS